MAQFAERKASLRAFIDAIEAVQSALFGGEDALDSNTRGFLDEAIRAQEAPEKVLDLYERIPPQGDDPEPWPHVVAAMGDTIYETLRPHYEAAIRGGGI
jgi:hypothetical protein